MEVGWTSGGVAAASSEAGVNDGSVDPGAHRHQKCRQRLGIRECGPPCERVARVTLAVNALEAQIEPMFGMMGSRFSVL